MELYVIQRVVVKAILFIKWGLKSRCYYIFDMLKHDNKGINN
jgi:hypothetical protein